MDHTRRNLIMTAGATVGLAGCLGGPSGSANDPTQTPETDATVTVANHDEYGNHLVGPDGLSLYLFEDDTKGADESTCSGGCADAWPPLTIEAEPIAGSDVQAELSTFEREDGSEQVTAGGWPLYYYQQDSNPGDTEGHGANGVWWLISPTGSKIEENKNPGGGGY